MIIIDSASARAQGLKKFYTGRPCMRGHDSERYVGGGACIACSYEKTGRAPPALVADASDVPKGPNLVTAMLETLPEQNIRCHIADLPELRTMATLLCMAAQPGLTVDQLRSKKQPIKHEGQTALHRLRFPAEAFPVMLALSNKLLAIRSAPAVAQFKASQVRAAVDLAAEERTEGLPGEWTFS